MCVCVCVCVCVCDELTGELGESAGSQLLNSDTLLLGDAGGETESLWPRL